MFDVISPSPNVAEPAAQPEPESSPVADDMPQLQNLRQKFEAASKRTGVPVDVLAGIASRESHVGKALDSSGFDPAKKTAFGIMQVDTRYHQLVGAKDAKGHPTPSSQGHINQAAGILRDNKAIMDKRFPNWSDEQRWRAAAAGYNMGPGNVKTLDAMDQGTTGGDYSKDVMERAHSFGILKNKKKQ
jgi:soluble lytic murein transglycosylase-like protein